MSRALELGLGEDWVAWQVGLDDPARFADVAARFPGDPGAAQEILRTLDARARDAGDVRIAGVWVPAAADHEPRAVLMLRGLPTDRAAHKEYRRFVRGLRKRPEVPGTRVVDYEAAPMPETALGPVALQIITTAESPDDLVVTTLRFTVFPTDGDEVLVLDFESAYPALGEEIEADAVATVESLAYREGA
ncbi:hypothetical protein [Luteimicrobium subarcticum]|uniref:Uncharacterized protein n=1 Tax=Luteimicrobium subarcticum TaxID=620910 RepID=A0A2M8WVM3_9MICO|nr:hypothetical protein [Luteimicrobium subarcticum]PJI94968.1 hypothetical protein CLV34_0820 [Luteimicrobium subarcticum]